MITVVLSALLSHWRRHPLQALMLLAGLCVATALWSGVQAINAEARASYARAAAMVGQDRFDMLVSANGEDIDQARYIELRRAGWLVSPVVEGDWRVGGRRLRLMGVEPVTAPREMAAAATVEETGDLLAFIMPPGRVFIAPKTLESLTGADFPAFRPSPELLPGMAVADIGVAQQLLGKQGRITRLIVLPEQPAERLDLAAIAPELVLKRPDGGSDLSRLTDSFHLNLTAFGFLAFVVGLFIVYATVGLAFEQRRSTFRTLRSLGLSSRLLLGLILAELMGFALLAGLAGVGLGYVVALFLMPGVAGTLNSLYGAGVDTALTFRLEWIGSGLAISLGGTLISAMESLWRVSRLPLFAPAQPRIWAQGARRVLQSQSLLALFLLACMLGLAQFGGGLATGFAVLACLLLGAALLWPGVLSVVLTYAARRSKRPMAQWFWADTRQQIPGLSLAFMALLIAFSTNVGVGAMVESFRFTFTGWLDQRLAAELYVTTRTQAEADAVARWLAPKVDALLPIVNADAELLGQPGQVYGIADHATYRDHWPLLQFAPDVWTRVSSGKGVLVNEQFFRRSHLSLEDGLRMPGNEVLPVVGIYSDYGNPSVQAMVGLETFNRLFPDVPRLRMGVRVAPDKVAEIVAGLEAQFGLGPAQVSDQTTIKRRSIAVFEQTFAVTAALNVLTLGTAGIALFATMTTLSGMRLPQLAPVWAMGTTRATLARLELLRTALLVAATFLMAIPVGVALAWVLLAIVNVEAFGWRLPLRFFPFDWLKLGGFAAVAVTLSVMVPLVRLARLSPADLLKVFANER